MKATRADGEPQRLAQHHQLLRDGGVGHPLAAPDRDVPVHLGGPERREREGDLASVRADLEDADQVARLGPVEGDRVRAAPAGLDLLGVARQEVLQRARQRRGPRGCVIGIGGVALPLPGHELGRRPVAALGGADHPAPLLVEPAVSDPSPLEEPLHDSASLA